MKSRRHPVSNLTTQLYKHSAFERSNLSRIAIFYLKLFIQEPFRILEKVNYEDAIRDHELEQDPIFIIGHWRSGTSFLQYLLGKDPQFGYMNKFQVVFPDVFLYSERFLKPFINRIPKSLNLKQDAKNMSINLELDSPSEIEIALTTMISPASLHWGHIFPKNAWEYFDKYLFFDTAEKEEITRWKRDYIYLIKKISLKNDGRQILIKSPGNAGRIKKLLEVYPDARFIFIHRNPYDVFYSSKKLWNTLLDNLALQDFSKQQMEQEIIRVYKKLMSRYLQERAALPDGHLAEIRFEDFVTDPVPLLRDVYNILGITDFDNAKAGIEDFLKHKTNGKSEKYDYEDDIVKKLNSQWEFVFKEWDYPMIHTGTFATPIR